MTGWKLAPGLFDATGAATWDGRRTLRGIWVEHPLADEARRVRIYNAETGAAVDGALLKRDSIVGRDPVLISSEAAQALGVEPGDTARLRIIALTPEQDETVINPSLPDDLPRPMPEKEGHGTIDDLKSGGAQIGGSA